MRKICIFTLLMLVMAFGLSGCNGIEVSIDEVKTHTIFIKADGTIQSVVFEELDKEYYNKDELEKYINSQVEEYNKKAGIEAVTVEELSVEDSNAKLILSFSDMNEYSNFNSTELSMVEIFTGTVEQALQEGYTLSQTFVDAKSGKEVDKSEIVKELSYNIVIVTEDVDVITEKNIKYYSNDSIMLDKHTVQATKEGCMIIYK